jgi:uncharacterized protein (TIGR00369 family)
MTSFQTQDSDYERRIHQNFARQHVMHLIGATLTRVEAGAVDINLPFREDLTQQHGYIHAGIITTVADSACGYAAYTLMPADSEVLSVEFKVNLLRPARAETFVAEGRVLKAGKTLMVTKCDVYGRTGEEAKLVATMLATMIQR